VKNCGNSSAEIHILIGSQSLVANNHKIITLFICVSWILVSSCMSKALNLNNVPYDMLPSVKIMLRIQNGRRNLN
jgi:hypothetical protein